MTITLSELAQAVAGELDLSRGGNADLAITGARHPSDATPSDIAVAMDKRYIPALADTKATAAVVGMEAEVPDNITAIIRVPWAKRALVELTNLFAAAWHYGAGTHSTAVIDPTATIGTNVNIGPYCIVGPGSSIGNNTTLQAQVYVGRGTTIGNDGFIFAGVRIMDDSQIGDRVIIHPNAVIGSDGFSFVNAEKGSVEAFKEGRKITAINQHLLRIASLGPVVIGDDVEIGAGTTIDRATLRTTHIASGTKIDNQVQIGHNAQIGENVMVCGQTGIAGSSIIGNRVVLAASVGIADNVEIGEDAMVAAASGVGSNVPARTVVLGTPAQPIERARSMIMAQMRLPRLMGDLEEIRNRLKSLEDGDKNP